MQSSTSMVRLEKGRNFVSEAATEASQKRVRRNNKKATGIRPVSAATKESVSRLRTLNVPYKIKRGGTQPRTTYVCNCRLNVLRRVRPRKMRVRRRNSSSIEETLCARYIPKRASIKSGRTCRGRGPHE